MLAEGYYIKKDFSSSLKKLAIARKRLDKEPRPPAENEWQRLSELLIKAGYANEIANIKGDMQLQQKLARLQQERARLEQKNQRALQEKHRLLQEQLQLQSEVVTIKRTIGKNNAIIRQAEQVNNRNLDVFEYNLDEVLGGRSVTPVQVSNHPNRFYRPPSRQPEQQQLTQRTQVNPKKEYSFVK